MLAQLKILGILIYLSVSPFLCIGNCGLDEDIDALLSSNDVIVLKRLADQLQSCPDEKENLGKVFHKLGVVYYKTQLDSAIYYSEQSLAIRKDLFAKKPTVDLGKTYHNLGTFYLLQKRYTLAKSRLNHAVMIFQNLNEKRLIKSYFELSNLYLETGEYATAEELLHLVQKDSHKIEFYKYEGRALLNLGFLYLKKKDYLKSIEYLRHSEPIVEKYASYKDIASCYLNLAGNYLHINDFSLAIHYYKKANEIYKQVNDKENIAKCYNNIGYAYQKNHQNKQSLKALQKGLEIAKSCSSNKIIAQSYDHFGEYYLAEDEFLKALKYFQKAIVILTPKPYPTSDLEHPSAKSMSFSLEKIDLLVYVSDKANALQKLYHQTSDSKYLQSAVALFELGDGLIDQLRTEQSDDDSKLFWRKDAVPFYEMAIQVCYELGDAKNAFFFFEKSKAILLLEGMQMSDALELLPQTIKDEMNQLQKDILKLKAKINASDSMENDHLVKELLVLKNKYSEKTLSIAKKFPQYFDTKFNTSVIKLSTYQQKYLQNDEWALHFFYGNEFVYLLTISKDKVNMMKIGETPFVGERLQKYKSFFTDASKIENHPLEYLALSNELYQLFFKGINLNGIHQINVFPDGGLSELPFETLVRSPSKNVFDANYLLNDFDIYYGYSAKIFAKISNLGHQNHEESIIGFAPFTTPDTSKSFASLSFSDSEISEIQNYVHSELIRDKKATKERFVKDLGRSSVLHLSTHAFSNAQETQPYIAFSDSLLHLSEIYGLNMDVDLVVLSACETNAGKLSLGEGVMSLGRGFMYAGAKSLISSMWKINAKSTGMILTEFYKNLAKGRSKYMALSVAKRGYLSNKNVPSYEKSPYYWGGLVYFGDSDGLVLKREQSYSAYIYSSIFLVLLGLVFWFYFKRK